MNLEAAKSRQHNCQSWRRRCSCATGAARPEQSQYAAHSASVDPTSGAPLSSSTQLERRATAQSCVIQAEAAIPRRKRNRNREHMQPRQEQRTSLPPSRLLVSVSCQQLTEVNKTRVNFGEPGEVCSLRSKSHSHICPTNLLPSRDQFRDINQSMAIVVEFVSFYFNSPHALGVRTSQVIEH